MVGPIGEAGRDGGSESRISSAPQQSEGLGSQMWQMLKDYTGLSGTQSGQTPEKLGFPSAAIISESGALAPVPMPIDRASNKGIETPPTQQADISGFEKTPMVKADAGVNSQSLWSTDGLSAGRIPDEATRRNQTTPDGISDVDRQRERIARITQGWHVANPEFPSGNVDISGGGHRAATVPREQEAVRQPNGQEKGTGDSLENGKPKLPYEGESIRKFSPEINSRLGCALAVSEALHANDPDFPAGIVSNKRLEAELKRHGYEAVPVKQPLDESQVQAGDVIVGHRQPGMPGHAAISKGGNTLYENNSDSGTIRGDGNLDKFNKGMHDEKGNFNKNGFADVVVYRKVAPAAVNSQSPES
jgi:hypothetical protein